MKNSRLYEITNQIEQIIDTFDIQKVKSEKIVWYQYLAGVFDYNVTKGGYAQLLYNLKGNFLEDVEEMLNQFKANVALDYYLTAVKTCLEDIESYYKFIEEDYLENNPLKYKLQIISIDYFKNGVDFESEIAEFEKQNLSKIIDWIDSVG